MNQPDIQMLRPETLNPYDRNPRITDEDAIAEVADSIKRYGFQQPIVVDESMTVIVGHTRLRAAFKLGLKQVPVIIAKDLTEAEARAYRLADNRTAELTGWDMKELAREVKDLSDIPGFDDDELEALRSMEWDNMEPSSDAQDLPSRDSGFRTLTFHVPKDHAGQIKDRCLAIIKEYMTDELQELTDTKGDA